MNANLLEIRDGKERKLFSEGVGGKTSLEAISLKSWRDE